MIEVVTLLAAGLVLVGLLVRGLRRAKKVIDQMPLDPPAPHLPSGRGSPGGPGASTGARGVPPLVPRRRLLTASTGHTDGHIEDT